MVALLDGNVIIDALTNRPGSVEEERQILRLVASKKVSLAICSKQITDIHYVLRKYMPEESKRRTFIGLLLRSFEILPLYVDELRAALVSESKDYEDAVLIQVCKRNGIDAIVSNDLGGFSSSGIKVLSPKEYISTLSA